MIKINGKEYEPKEFTLGNYPECMAAMEKLNDAKDSKEKFGAMAEFLSVALGIEVAEAKKCTLKESKPAMAAIMEVNSLSPKAETPQQTEAGAVNTN